jgi:hypothetical protein
MKAVKGFNPDLTCDPTGTAPFQFVEGETYDLGRDAVVCKRGFHAVTMPIEVFSYYPPATSVYHEVEVDDNAQTHHQDSKVASRRITIGARVSIAGLVKAQFAAIWEKCTLEPGSSATGYSGAASATGDRGAASATGYSGAASATGDYGAASATGDRGAASATGDYGAASATGNRGAASATGNRGAASATGYSGAASATGYSGAASATGNYGAASATGYSGAASATGYSGAASATGYSGAASATGNSGAASATGDYGAASATGNRGAASATGNRGAASATGYSGAASATGSDSVAMASGYRGRAKGAEGCALMLVERDADMHIVAAKAVIVGRKSNGRLVKADTYYGLIGGRVVEVDESGEAVES